MSILYLAGPYSKGDANCRKARFEAITVAAARIIEREKKIVFSPLTMTHPIDLVMAADGETLGSEYWVPFDEAFMAFCDEFAVLKLPGWNESSGVRRELQHFKDKGVDPIFYEPSDFEISPSIEKFAAAF